MNKQPVLLEKNILNYKMKKLIYIIPLILFSCKAQEINNEYRQLMFPEAYLKVDKKVKKLCNRLDIDIWDIYEVKKEPSKGRRVKYEYYIPISYKHVNMTYRNWLGVEKRVISIELLNNNIVYQIE